MGVINWVAGKVIDKATDIVSDKIENLIFEKTVKHIENSHSVENIISNSVSPYRLYVSKVKKSNYIVKDEMSNNLFTIKANISKLECPYANLFDCGGNEIGKVVLETKNLVTNYGIYLKGYKLGNLKIGSKFGTYYEIDFKDWNIECVLSQFKTNIIDKEGNLIAKFNLSVTDNVSYVLEYNKKDNEILILLLLMALYIIK